jgi:hypothetical protein
MSSLVAVITFAHITSAEGGGRWQQCHGRRRGRCQHGRMGAGSQKLWLIILLGERQDERALQKTTRPKFKLHEIEKDLNESILTGQGNMENLAIWR